MGAKRFIQQIGELVRGDVHVPVWRSVWPEDISRSRTQVREDARRRRQILRGQLTPANGLAGGLEALNEAYQLEHPLAIKQGLVSRLREKLGLAA